MISTGDWVPILQFKVTISDMEFFNEDLKKIFETFISKDAKRLEYTHFLKTINIYSIRRVSKGRRYMQKCIS